MSPPRPTFSGLLAAEVTKLLGRGWLVAALLAPAIAVVLRGMALRLAAVQQALLNGGTIPEEGLVDTAFRPAATALYTGAVVSAIITGVAAALALSEERRLGTLRTVLTAPVRRWRFFLAKAAGVLFLSCLLVGSSTLVALITGGLLGDYVAAPDWEYHQDLGLTVANVWRTFLLAALVTWAATVAVGCLGLLASSITSNGVEALITLALLVVALLFLPRLLPTPGARSACFALSPLSYVTHPAQFVGDRISGIGGSYWSLIPMAQPEWEIYLPWVVTVFWTLVFAAAGLFVFARRRVL